MKMTKLAEIRKQKGLTQEELAQKLGVKDITISRYERGERQLTIEKAQAIANALGCTISELIGG